MELIIGLGIGLIFFLCTIKAYTIGIKHGKQLANNEVPKVNLNPVEAVQKHIEVQEEKKQADLFERQWNNLMSYDGSPQKEVEE